MSPVFSGLIWLLYLYDANCPSKHSPFFLLHYYTGLFPTFFTAETLKTNNNMACLKKFLILAVPENSKLYTACFPTPCPDQHPPHYAASEAGLSAWRYTCTAWRIAAALASISRVSWSALWMQILYTLCLPEPSSIPGNWHGRCRRTSSRQRLQERDCNKPWMKKSPVCCSPLPAAKSSCVSMAGEAMGSLQMRVYSMCRWSLGLIQLLVGFPAASGAYMEK